MNHRYNLTLLTIAGTLLGASAAVNAQSAAPAAPAAPASNAPSAMHGHHRGMMGRALHGIALSATEKSNLVAARAKIKAARTAGTPETREQARADIEGALTPAHRTQFESNIATMRAERKTAH